MKQQIALNVDCMEYMRTLPDKAFDLAIVDPPYGISIHDSGRLKEFIQRKSPWHCTSGYLWCMGCGCV